MARIPYVSRDTMPEGRVDLYDRLVAQRGPNVENIFLALANAPDLTEAVLGMATALRQKTALSRVFRELAVVTVGLQTGASYEVDHHWNAALRAGVRREQLEALQEFETADCFTERERAVIRLAKEVTAGGEGQRRHLGCDGVPGPAAAIGVAADHCLVQLRSSHSPAAADRQGALVRAAVMQGVAHWA
jgi:AhpD family alkylhydroperoxidase